MEELAKNETLTERQHLTKKQRKLLRGQQKEKDRLRRQRQKKFKNLFWVVVGVLVIGGGILGGGWFLATRPSLSASEIISTQGIHWHTELSITILDQKQDIPANIGIGIPEQPIHTHEEDNTLHLEFSGSVEKNDIRLGRFFEIWGKQFNQDCVFINCNGPEGKVKMLVNGEPNFEFENYIMNDGDKIEIIFEK